jgi:hypothetical protein
MFRYRFSLPSGGGRGVGRSFGGHMSVLGPICAVFAVFLLAASPGFAQDTGVIAGRVVDGRNGEPLSTAQVFIPSIGLGTLTDLDGRYRIPAVPAGQHELRFETLGYRGKYVTEVEVSSGQTTTVDVALDFAPIEVGAITVTADAEQGSISALLNAQKNAVAVTDAIGEEQIARSPDVNVAEVASRVSGVTVADGRYVYIRGLGERYSQTLFSGSPMPSPEPEKETVPLDLFPAAFVETITTQKTYTPDKPGDFSGGSLEVQNKDFPTQLTWSIRFGSGVNTNSQFQNNFFSYAGGATDWLGKDDGSRAIPQVVTDAGFGLRGNRLPADPEALKSFGTAFAQSMPQFAPEPQTTPANVNGGFSVGSRNGNFGWLVSGSYNSRYWIVDDEVEAKWRAEAFDPSLPDETRDQPNVRYAFNRNVRRVVLGAMGNFSYLISPTQQISLRTMFNRNTDNEARLLSGANNEDLGGVLFGERLRFQERELLWGQLSGKHQLPLDSKLDWRFVLGRATLDEPGLRETIYNQTFNQPDAPHFLEDVGESSRYFFSNLADNEVNGGLDWEVPLKLGPSDAGFVKVGFFNRHRDRGFAARLFRFTYVSGVIDRDPVNTTGSQGIDAILSDPNNVVGSNPQVGEVMLEDIAEPGDVYDATDDRIAGYGMIELPLGGFTKLLVGARYETYDLQMLTPSQDATSPLTDLRQSDLLPALNLTFALNQEMNLRLGGSRTLDRPEFRELAPFLFTEALSLRQIFGNPDLQVAEITNADLRWEWFPASGEVLSVSGFYKNFQDPIEQVFIATASAGYSYQNADKADLYGAEIAFRKRLSFIGDFWDRLFLGGNAMVSHSSVHVIPGGIFDPTNLERPLEGQSPYVVNLDLSYVSPGGLTDLGLYYNVYGDRIAAAGGSGVPDIVEQSRHLLDLTWVQGLWQGLRMKVKVQNLLNSPFRWEQEANGIAQIQREYTIGRTISIGFSYGG